MKKVLKKCMGILLILTLSLSVMAGCSNGVKEVDVESKADNAEGSATTEKKKDVTLTVMGTSDSVKEIERTEIAKLFKEETGITVDYQLVQDSQFESLLNTKLNSGTSADIFVTQSGKLNIEARYNPEKNCVDLSGEDWIGIYDELVMENSSVDGKVYCQTLWNTNSVWAMVYNKKMFEANNLEVPTTYAEFEAICEVLSANGTVPVYECAADAWHPVCSYIEMMVKVELDNPGTYEKLNKNEIKIADIPEMTILTEQFNTIGQEYSGDGVLSNEFANSAAALSDGSHAMTVNRVDLIAQFDKDYPDGKYKSEDFGAFVVPYIDNQIRNVNPQGNSRFVFSGSENIDEAKEYLSFIARPEILQMLVNAEPSFSWLPFKGIEANFIPAEDEFYTTYAKAGTVPQSAVKYIDPQWMDMANDVQALYTDQISVEQFLKNIDDRRAEQAEEAGDEFWN